MRRLALIAALTTLLAPSAADARLFWQTYGATVASEGGAGCHWNLNQDYFVPRHCDSCQYGLFSACKTDRSISPACKNLHPAYAGYCTPYGSCHYKRRDHVYKTHCGCTPLRCEYGPWHLEKCGKHALVMRHSQPACSAACGLAAAPQSGDFSLPDAHAQHIAGFEHVEPFGGETLGFIAALPAGTTGGGSAAAIPTAVGNPLPPKLELVPRAPAGSSLPAPFGY